MRPEEYEGEQIDPSCPRCDGLGSHVCPDERIRELAEQAEQATIMQNRKALAAAYREAVEALEELHEVLTLGTLEAAAKYGPDYDRDAADRHAAERSEAVLAKAREVLEPEKP